MLAYTLRRLLQGAVVLLAVIWFSFTLSYFQPDGALAPAYFLCKTHPTHACLNLLHQPVRPLEAVPRAVLGLSRGRGRPLQPRPLVRADRVGLGAAPGVHPSHVLARPRLAGARHAHRGAARDLPGMAAQLDPGLLRDGRHVRALLHPGVRPWLRAPRRLQLPPPLAPGPAAQQRRPVGDLHGPRGVRPPRRRP